MVELWEEPGSMETTAISVGVAGEEHRTSSRDEGQK